MSYKEDLARLRNKFQEALAVGLIKEKNRDIFESTLIQIMNESEKKRQEATKRAEEHKRQASALEGQASGFAANNSIIYNVLTSYVAASIRDTEEIAELEARENVGQKTEPKSKPKPKKARKKRASKANKEK